MFKRVVTRSLHRAFPELDRFDDGRASAFVASAARGWRRTIVRWVALVLTVVICAGGLLVGTALAMHYLEVDMYSWSINPVYVGIALLAASIGLGLVLALLVRDRVLRQSIRRLIKNRGTCWKCAYSLLGMPIGPDLRLTCPECGTVTVADPSMGELVPSVKGAVVYVPQFAVEGAEQIAARKRRHRSVCRISLCLVLGVVVAGVGCYAGLRVFLWWQAREARAILASGEFNAKMVQVQEKLLRPGVAATEPNQWGEVVDALEAFKRAERAVCTAYFESHPDVVVQDVVKASGVFAPVLKDYISDFDPWYDNRMNPSNVNDDLVGLLDAELKRSGADAKLRSLAALRRAVRPMVVAEGQSPMALQITDLQPLRMVAEFNTARMVRAARSGDGQGYIDALEQGLAVADLIGRQGTHIDTLTANRQRNLLLACVRATLGSLQSDEVLARVDEVIARQAGPTGSGGVSASMIEVEEFYYRAWIAEFFSKPGDVERVLLWGFPDDTMYTSRHEKGKPMLGKLGTLRSNLDDLCVGYKRIGADLALTPDVRASVPLSVPRGSKMGLVRDTADSLGRSMVLQDSTGRTTWAGTRVMVALERFKLRTGAFPASLSELGEADGVTASNPLSLDPFSGKAFGFERTTTDRQNLTTAGKRHKNTWGYWLWSVSADGVDDQGSFPEWPSDSMRTWAGPSGDYLINEQHRWGTNPVGKGNQK